MSYEQLPRDLREPENERPTFVRYGVLFFLCTMAMLLYVDRVCIGQATPHIMSDLGLNKFQMSLINNAFLLAYTLFEVPTGHWADRYGCRGVIARIVVAWSVFTALTGASFNLWSMMAVRFLFGAGEAGAFPNSALVVTKWFPLNRRGLVRGLITTTSMLGGSIGNPVAAYLILWVGWRGTFGIFGLVGLLWAGLFYWWFRDRPADHFQTNVAEVALIESEDLSGTPLDGSAAHRTQSCPMCGKPVAGSYARCPHCGESLLLEHSSAPSANEPVHVHDQTAGGHDADHASHAIPWSIVLASPNVWLLGTIMMAGASLFYMQFQWYPTYLKEARGVSTEASGWLTSAVLLGGALGCIAGGFAADIMVRLTGSRRWGRRLMGWVGLGLAALCVGMVNHVESTNAATLLNSAALFFLQTSLPTWWSVVAEISGRHGASMFGLMNSLGGLGTMASTALVGWFVDLRTQQGYSPIHCWIPVFYGVAGVLLAGAVMWLLVDPTRSIVERAEPESA